MAAGMAEHIVVCEAKAIKNYIAFFNQKIKINAE